MIATMFWISLRFAFVALPLFLTLVAARRAFVSSGPNAAIYMTFAGFSGAAGLSVMPWAMHLEDPSPVSLILSLTALLLWLILNRAIRRPVFGYRRGEEVRPVFRHRALPPPSAAGTTRPRPADWPDLPFLPQGTGRRLQ